MLRWHGDDSYIVPTRVASLIIDLSCQPSKLTESIPEFRV